MSRDLGIGGFCTSSPFLILFQSKYSLLRSTRENASVGVAVGIPDGDGKEPNNDHISHKLSHGGEGMMTRGCKMVI